MSKLIVGCPDCGDQCEPCDKVLLDAEGADVGSCFTADSPDAARALATKAIEKGTV